MHKVGMSGEFILLTKYYLSVGFTHAMPNTVEKVFLSRTKWDHTSNAGEQTIYIKFCKYYVT